MSSSSTENELKKIDYGSWIMKFIFLGLGVVIMISSWGYGLRTDGGLVGPGLMPFIASAVTVVASLFEIVKAFMNKNDVTAGAAENAIADADDLSVSGKSQKEKNLSVVFVFGTIFGTIVLTHLIGLLLSLAIMAFVLVALVERKPVWTAILTAIGTFVFGYFVFKIALQVPLPTGLLGLV